MSGTQDRSGRYNDTGTEPFRAQFPYQSRFFNVGAYRLHYIDEGCGPLILMLHACPLWSFEFRHLIRVLKKTHRVIALDQMGFGLSDKPQDFDYRIETHTEHMERFVREMDLKDITLLMHGRGSAVGMSYAIRHTANIRGFVTLNTMAFSDFGLPWRLMACRWKWIGAKLALLLNIFQRDTDKLPPDVREAYNYPFPTDESKIAFQRFIEDIPCVPEDSSSQTMFEIEASLWLLREKPAAIIWSKHDWMYPERNLKKWQQYFPKANVYMLENSGRCPTEDCPEQIEQIVSAFLMDNDL